MKLCEALIPYRYLLWCLSLIVTLIGAFGFRDAMSVGIGIAATALFTYIILSKWADRWISQESQL